MKTIILFLLGIILCSGTYAADSLRALFIGNSYTGVNNLPVEVQKMANANGDYLEIGASTPGGMTLNGQLNVQQTINLLQQGDWDFVVLQGQSQIPSFPESQVETMFYPAAKTLDSLIHVYSPCAKTVFYMTWGREFGDAQNCVNFSPVCTYEGMDSLLRLRYSNIADTVSGYISPVGPVWHYLRTNNPGLDLYQPDHSHPTMSGTFAAACSFYTLFFGENPQNNSYHSTLSTATATTIKNAAKAVAFDSLNYWQRFNLPPVSNFDYTLQDGVSADTVVFTNLSDNAEMWFWQFGDGQTSTAENPSHVYTASGNYTVCLNAIKECDTVVFCDSITVQATGGTAINSVLQAEEFKIYPNPVDNNLILIQPSVRHETGFTIYNMLGRLVQQGTLKKGATHIALKAIPSGIYILKLSNRHGDMQHIKFQKR